MVNLYTNFDLKEQRKGFGGRLIVSSYELSKKKGKSGRPEKPPSNSELRGYCASLFKAILELLLEQHEISVGGLPKAVAITIEDIAHITEHEHTLCSR